LFAAAALVAAGAAPPDRTALAAPGAQTAAAEPVVRLLRSDDAGIVVTMDAPVFDIRREGVGGDSYDAIDAPGLATSGPPGYPDLPVAAVMLGIPPRGAPRVRATVAGTWGWHEAVRVAPVPSPGEVSLDGWLQPSGAPVAPAPGGPGGAAPRTVRSPDPGAYADAGLFPGEPAAITEVGWIRGQRVARLELRPFQYRAAGGTLRVHDRVTVELTFEPSPAPRLSAAADEALADGAAGEDDGGGPPDSAFDPVLDRVLLNAAAARPWRVDRPAAYQSPPVDNLPLPPSESQAVWNIAVEGEGVVRLTGTDLALAGVPIETIDPRRLQLYAAGRPVALRIADDRDGRLSVSDALMFYAEPNRSRYAALNVYQLAYGDAAGRRMAERDGTPGGAAAMAVFTATLRLEQDAVYRSDYPKRGGTPADATDHWFWQQLSAPQSMTQALALPDLAPGDWTARLRVAVVGKSSFPAVAPDHRLKVYVGGRLAGERTWDGNTTATVLSMPVASDLLGGGTAELRLEAPAPDSGPGGFYDHYYIDWIEIDYRRGFTADARGLRFTAEAAPSEDFDVDGLAAADVAVYDVTDPAAPVVVTGADVRGSAGAYRLRFGAGAPGRRTYIVAPRAGYRAAARIEARPMADLRSSERAADYIIVVPASLKAAVGPLADARAAQGYRVAVVDAQSIYDAFNGGMMAPEAIRDFIAYAYHNWHPPAPSHVLLVGDGTYDARNRLGISPPTLIPPFLREADPWLGEVAVENAFVAVSGDDLLPDLYLGRLPVNSPAEATATINKILGYAKPSPDIEWRYRLLFATDNPDSAGDFYALSDDIVEHHVPPDYLVDRVYLGRTHADKDDARAAILRGMNDGYLLTQYTGHGLQAGWAQELMLSGGDMRSLANGVRAPVMLDMTCMTGYFTDPRVFSIAEMAVRARDGGAIAAFSPTGFGVASGHDYINRWFVDDLLGRGVTHLGQVAVASKLHLATSTTAYRDLLETLALLGDPALEVQVPFVPDPTATPRATAEATVMQAPSGTRSPTPTVTPTPTATAEATTVPTPTVTDEATAVPSSTATGEPTADATSTPTGEATAVASRTATDEATGPPAPTATVDSTPAAPPTPSDTATAAATPTATDEPTPGVTPAATGAGPETATPTPSPESTSKATPPNRFDTPSPSATPSATHDPPPTVTPSRVRPSPTATDRRVKKAYLPFALKARPPRRR